MIESSTVDRPMAVKITASGGYTYIAQAPLPGSRFSTRAAHEASAEWQVQRVDSNGSTEWADGDAEYDNVATDLTALTYR